jgi:hypothetical protein
MAKGDAKTGLETQGCDPSRLDKFMDPSERGKVYAGKPYKFIGWEGPVKEKDKTIRVYVNGETRVTAHFERQ